MVWDPEDINNMFHQVSRGVFINGGDLRDINYMSLGRWRALWQMAGTREIPRDWRCCLNRRGTREIEAICHQLSGRALMFKSVLTKVKVVANRSC